jgi:hypothetical protein
MMSWYAEMARSRRVTMVFRVISAAASEVTSSFSSTLPPNGADAAADGVRHHPRELVGDARRRLGGSFYHLRGIAVGGSGLDVG